jgi:serine/threonine protein phosphatase PrpC
LVLETEEALAKCALEIDQKIKEKAKELNYPGMGTTLALAKIHPQNKTILTANAGDSPIFLIKGGESNKVILLYKDDSERFEDPDNMWSITQYLGYGENVDVHTKSENYEKGDILLLCSDGVSDNILGTTNEIPRLSTFVKEEKSAKRLVELAMNTRLKSDDMSAILVFL